MSLKISRLFPFFLEIKGTEEASFKFFIPAMITFCNNIAAVGSSIPDILQQTPYQHFQGKTSDSGSP